MSLSAACQAQHDKESAIARKWLLIGLAVAIATPLGLLPLLMFLLPGAPNSSTRISIDVFGELDSQGEVVEQVSPPEEVFDFVNEAEPSGTESAAFEAEAIAPVTAVAPLISQPQLNDSTPSPSFDSSDFDSSETRLNDEIEEQVSLVPADETDADRQADADSEDEDRDTGEPLEDSLNAPEETASAEVPESESSESESLESESSDGERFQTAAGSSAGSRSSSASSSVSAGSSSAQGTSVAATGRSETTQPTSATEAGLDRPGASALGSGLAVSRREPISCRSCNPTALLADVANSGARVEPSVRLAYDENGNVVGAELERSSGDASVDQAAIEAALLFTFNTSGQSGNISVDFQINPDAPLNNSSNAPVPSQREQFPNPQPSSPQSSVEPEPEASSQPVPSEAAPASAADLTDDSAANLEISPDSLDTELPAPEPESVEAISEPEPSASGLIAPEPTAPEPVVPEPVVPEPRAPEPTAPEPVFSEPVAPEPAAPLPAEPESALSEPAAPAPEPVREIPDFAPDIE